MAFIFNLLIFIFYLVVNNLDRAVCINLHKVLFVIYKNTGKVLQTA